MPAKPKFDHHLPPRPWTYMVTALPGRHEGSGLVWINDATGKKVAGIYGTPDQKLALAELILEAVDARAAVLA